MTHDSRTHRRSAVPGSASRAFSLVEILIAILILGLGLLGLGAVFPAVIAQQRGAVEKTQGAAVAASAAATLRGGGELANWSVLSGDKFFSQDQNMIGGVSGGSYRPTSFWEAEWPVTDTTQTGPNPSLANLTFYRDTGTIQFGSSVFNDASFPTQNIPELARLSPPAFSGQTPKYVWDFVARRSPATKQIEVALFIRNIDSRIRTSGDTSLSEMIARPDVFAVAVDQTTGLSAAGDHPNAEYAVPLSLAMEIPLDGNEPILNRIRFLDRFPLSGLNAFDAATPDEDTRIELASQIGQKLVDNFGVVRRVVRVVENEVDTVEVEPPFTRQQAFGGFSDGNGAGGVSANTIDPVLAQQVVFTPQIPVSVEVFRVE